MSSPASSKLAHRFSKSLARRAESFVIRQNLSSAGVINVEAIPTHTRKVELEALFSLASACPQGASVLEIGSYLGAATCYIAAGLAEKGGRVYCVDTWQNETMPEGERDTFSEFERNISGVKRSVTIVRKNSQDLNSSDISTPLSLVFIDGDHGYGAVKSDFELTAPWMSTDGVICFHDCRFFEGVSRVIGEALSTGEWMIAGHIENLLWIRRADWCG